MKINKNILNDIFKREPMFPPETGGIIGMKKDVKQVISNYKYNKKATVGNY